MSWFDNDHNPINIPLPTMGGEVFWDNLEECGGYVLQKNTLFGNCRILDENKFRVAWGEEGPMRARFRELTLAPEDRHPHYGDVIGVHRINGLYDHYGIYESDSCVYEYAARNGDFGDADIHTTTLRQFIRDSNNLFVLVFPETHQKPGKQSAMPGAAQSVLGSLVDPHPLSGFLRTLLDSKEYHLYSPQETIQRARRRLGESRYNLVFRNCEHYALWCKTGVEESHQVDSLLRYLSRIASPIPLR